MAITTAPYAGFLLGLPKAQFNLEGGTIRVALVDATYVPNMKTHVYLTDVTGLISAAAEKTLTNVKSTYNEDTFTVTVTANAVVWQVATFTARWAVLYQWTGTAGSSRLIGYIDFGTAREYDAEDLTLNLTGGFARFPAS